MKRFPFLLLLGVILIIFHQWFSFQVISGGDYPFLFRENLNERVSFPLSWNEGQYNASFLNSYLPILVTGFLSKLGLDFIFVERLVWFWLFLVLTPFSSWYLAKTVFSKNQNIRLLAPFIYLFNTYILMIIGGGQVGIAMAYALAPFVFGLFINLLTSSRVNELKRLVLVGIALAIQVMFDPRISFLTMGAVFLYVVFQYDLAVKKHIRLFVLPFFIALGIHFYWLLPSVLVRRAVLPAGYGEPGWVEFLSFGNFSDTISLLHPNWPEDIFGKTYFMRPEFLVIPILAFSSLLFTRIKANGKRILTNERMNVLFFASLALIGAFLAKGSKPPFGGVYLWLFKNLPGMNMFRDPTKFYLLVCLSYSLLIPFSLTGISRRLKKISNIKYLISSIFIIYWLFLIRPAWLGQLGGTFKARKVPQEYVILKDFIHNQEEFFRTFWIPKKQRFGFFSNNHPAIESPELLSEEELAVRGVKYVIIPFDSEGEIFLEDRKYDHQQRLALEEELDKVSWLKKIDVTDKIAVYQTPRYKDHFFIDSLSGSEVNELTSWQMINPTKYIASVKINQPPATLVFSETYDELWQAKIGERIIPSTMYNNLNGFTIDRTGDFEIMVEFMAQKYVYWGLAVSGITMLFIIYSLLMS